MAKVTWIVGRRVPRLYCLTPLPRRRTNSQSPTYAHTRHIMPLPRFYPRLWPSVSPCPPPLAPPRHLRPGPNPNPTARCSSPRYAFAGTPPTHTGTDAPPHPRIHHVPRFASPTRHAAAPPSANHAVEPNRNRLVDGTETKSTSITCVAPAPGPTERPGRVTYTIDLRWAPMPSGSPR